MTTVGERIRTERERQGKSRAELARAAGMAVSTLSDLELGLSGTTTKLHRIAAFLGLRTDWLETGKGQKESGTVVALPSQPAGFSRERMAKAVEVTRYWIDFHGLQGGVEDHIPLLHLALELTLAAEESATVMDLSKKLAARLREEKPSDGDQRRDPVEPGQPGGEVRGKPAARRRKAPAADRS